MGSSNMQAMFLIGVPCAGEVDDFDLGLCDELCLLVFTLLLGTAAVQGT